MSKVTPFLMFNDQLEAAMEFYAATFPGSEIRNVARTGSDGPIASAEFVVGGQLFMGYNGGRHFTFSEGFSLFVDCEDQAEVDRYWDKLVRPGQRRYSVAGSKILSVSPGRLCRDGSWSSSATMTPGKWKP